MTQLANIKNTIIFFVCPSRRVVPKRRPGCRGRGVFFSKVFFCLIFCRYSPVMLYPNVRYFSFIRFGYYPPKICIGIVFISTWELEWSQEKLEKMLMQNLEGQTKINMIFLILAN